MSHTVSEEQRAQRFQHWPTVVGGAAIVLALLVAPQFMYPVFVMKMMCYALFAATFNLIFGYAGLMSFGHAAFFGAGGYLAGYAARDLGVGPATAVVIGLACAGLLGAAVGALATRRKGIEFAMITLAMAELVAFIAHRAPFTGGENGLQNIPRGTLFGLVNLSVPSNLYLFVLGVLVIGMLVLWVTVHSPFGHILQAIREHESRAISLGYDVARYKLVAFIISAAIAGMAGATKGIALQFVSLEDVSTTLSGQVVLMTLLGGLGRFYGPFFGAVIVVALESYLAASSFPAPVITGVVFVLCVMLFRRGLVGEIATRIEQRGNGAG